MLIIFVFISALCWLGSLICLFLCQRLVARVSKALFIIDRLRNTDESIVRAVMEDDGEASIEAVMRTCERLVDKGMAVTDALKQAREICKKN